MCFLPVDSLWVRSLAISVDAFFMRKREGRGSLEPFSKGRRDKRRRFLHSVFLLSIYLFSSPLILGAQEESPRAPVSPVQGEGLDSQSAQGPAAEQQAPNYEYTEPDLGENRVSYSFLVLRTVVVLAAIVLGIYFLFRILLKSRNRLMSDTDIVKVLASYPLAANRFLQIVDIAGQILILGVTESNINLITTVEDKEVIDAIKLASSKKTVESGTFKEQFLKLLGGGAFARPGKVSYLSGYKKRINKMKKL